MPSPHFGAVDVESLPPSRGGGLSGRGSVSSSSGSSGLSAVSHGSQGPNDFESSLQSFVPSWRSRQRQKTYAPGVQIFSGFALLSLEHATGSATTPPNASTAIV